MAFIAEGGAEVTDDMLERWADDAEQGKYQGRPGMIFVGRPPLTDEELASVTFKVQPSVLKLVDTQASATGISRSEFIRRALTHELANA